MKVSIQFQYMPDETRRPLYASDHNDPFVAEDGQFLPVPDVGDTVSYESYQFDYDSSGKVIEDSGRVVMVVRKVRTRHFTFNKHGVWINIVVVDVPKGEMAMRLKD
jgi:hypothetical protein